MEALKIEILNPKAMQLIEGMQALKLIKVSKLPEHTMLHYLEQLRAGVRQAPDLEEITALVEEARAKRKLICP